MMSLREKNGCRLVGPVPVNVKMDLDPVEAEITNKPWPIFLVALVVLLLAATTIPFDVISTAMSWTPGRYVDLVTIIIGTFLLVLLVPFVTVIMRVLAYQVFGTRVVLSVDDLRVMRDDRILVTIQFDDKIGLNIRTHGESTSESYEGYNFIKGWKIVTFATSEEDRERLWPLVEAAAWKHRMLLGPVINDLIENKEG
jgi:hypothetical protein